MLFLRRSEGPRETMEMGASFLFRLKMLEMPIVEKWSEGWEYPRLIGMMEKRRRKESANKSRLLRTQK